MANSSPNRIIALDLGKARIGVAVGEIGGGASGLCVLERRGRDKDIRAIGQLLKEQEAGMIVMGLPRKSPNELGPMAESALRLGKRLSRALKVPVEYVDEFETTCQAHEAMIEAGLGRKKRRQLVDQAAASLILRRYLDGQGEAP